MRPVLGMLPPAGAASAVSGLHVESLRRSFDGCAVLRDISLDVAPGAIVALLGSDGSGRSLCFELILGLVRVDGGHVVINGEDVTRMPAYKRGSRGLGFLPSGPCVAVELSVEDNILITLETAVAGKAARAAAMEEVLKQFHLMELRKTHARALSGGERRRLELARAKAANPTILLLDEPFAGIDPLTVKDIQNVIRQLAQSGVGMLIADNNFEYITEISEYIYLINKGFVIFSGTVEEMFADSKAKQFYLGKRAPEFAEEYHRTNGKAATKLAA